MAKDEPHLPRLQEFTGRIIVGDTVLIGIIVCNTIIIAIINIIVIDHFLAFLFVYVYGIMFDRRNQVMVDGLGLDQT